MGDLDSEQKIKEIDDLEDRLLVLESVVSELKGEKIPTAQLKIVKTKQLLNQYIILEDSILAGLDFLTEDPRATFEKNHLKDCAAKYNEFGADFQDSWTEEYWDLYELIREGYKSPEKNKTNTEIISEVAELQELAITMNRRSNHQKQDSKAANSTLQEIDELAKQYGNSTILAGSNHEALQEQQSKKKCCSSCCVV